MKLDKMKFAKLVAMLVSEYKYMHDDIIEQLDTIIDIDVQPVPLGLVDPAALHRLLGLMKEGTQKIEAIKQHRLMTGYGLKESKDAVERHWPVAKPTENQIAAKLMACFACDEDKAYDVARQLVELR